jgi:hypothetical protein
MTLKSAETTTFPSTLLLSRRLSEIDGKQGDGLAGDVRSLQCRLETAAGGGLVLITLRDRKTRKSISAGPSRGEEAVDEKLSDRRTAGVQYEENPEGSIIHERTRGLRQCRWVR